MGLVEEAERRLDAPGGRGRAGPAAADHPRRRAAHRRGRRGPPGRRRSGSARPARCRPTPGWCRGSSSPGEMDRRGRITRRGPGLLRKVLVEAAWLMQRYNGWAARTSARIGKGQRTRRKQALVAVARKLLVRCWAMLRHGTAWDERLAAAG